MIAYLNDIPDRFKEKSGLYKATVLDSPNEIVEIIHKRKLNFTPNTADLLEILQYIDTCSYLDCEFPLGPFFLEQNRKSAVLQEMREFEYSIMVDIKSKWSEYSYFAKTYEYNAVKALYQYYHSSDMNIHAIRNKSLILFRYCVEWTAIEAHTAVYYGQIDILEYIHKDRRGKTILEDTVFQRKLCMVAVSKGNIKMLHFLRETLLFEWDESCLEAAIDAENYCCIEYIVGNFLGPFRIEAAQCKRRQRGFPITDLSIRAAIEKGKRVREDSSDLVNYLLNA
jgi:hypothetical protein